MNCFDAPQARSIQLSSQWNCAQNECTVSQCEQQGKACNGGGDVTLGRKRQRWRKLPANNSPSGIRASTRCCNAETSAAKSIWTESSREQQHSFYVCAWLFSHDPFRPSRYSSRSSRMTWRPLWRPQSRRGTGDPAFNTRSSFVCGAAVAAAAALTLLM